MSRSGYSDDMEGNWQWIMWRGAVASSIRGKRGQALLVEALAALDAMPVKELVADELVQNGAYCLLGAVGAARGIDVSKLDPEDYTTVAKQFNIAEPLAREIAFMNDEGGLYWTDETPAQRWTRMRNWVAAHIKE